MKELIYENQLKDTRDAIFQWVDLLRDNGNVTNVTEWMLQEANRIQIRLDH